MERVLLQRESCPVSKVPLINDPPSAVRQRCSVEKSVRSPAKRRLQGVDRWKVGRMCFAGDISVAGTIHGDADSYVVWIFAQASTEVGGVKQYPGRAELCHKGVAGSKRRRSAQPG